ncbi:MAG TPA: cell division protein ZapB [Gammaproteobacteria bacterium]|nr:cell division protein ZapB [Gammaproteobacteria bacterium]
MTVRSGKIIVVIVSKITEKEVLEVIEILETRVDDLIQKCDQLNIENQSLKENNQELSETQQSILKKNNLAKSKAETILERLRSIENSA